MSVDGVDMPEHEADDVESSVWGVLETLGRALHVQEPTLEATLQAILRAAVDSVAGTDFAGVNLWIKGRFVPQAVEGEPPHRLDALQRDTGVGPCIDASRDQRVIRVDDLAAAERWPDYGALAASIGVRSMLCVPLWVDERRLGSISLYSQTLNAFDVTSERVARLLGVHAAVALAEADRRANLTAALHNRDVIGQAKGILMATLRVTSDKAFELLSQASQRTNRKLVVVAEEVATTGALRGV